MQQQHVSTARCPQPLKGPNAIWRRSGLRLKAGAATRFAKDQLKSIVERIERLDEERKTISDDIRDVYAEAKGNGFDVRALRTIVRLRKQDARGDVTGTPLEPWVKFWDVPLYRPKFRALDHQGRARRGEGRD